MPLKVSDGMGAWIKDFQKSDAPQFKANSKDKRRDQAIAAYLSAKRGPQNESTHYDIDKNIEKDIKKRNRLMQKKNESSAEYAKSIERINKKKRDDLLKPGEKDKIDKIRDMMKKANEDIAGGITRRMGSLSKVTGPNRSTAMAQHSKLNTQKSNIKAKNQAQRDIKNRMQMNNTNESIGQTPGDHSYHYLQKAKRMAAKDGHDYDKLPAYDRTHDKHKDYYDQKARNENVKEGMTTGNETGMMFRVKIEGLPDMIMVGRSPSDIKQQLRKIVKQPSMIDSVDRMPKSQVRKMYRDLAGGKDIDEAVHHIDQHDNTDIDFIKLTKKHGVKHKAAGDGTKMTGHPNNIKKVLSVMPNHDPSDFKENYLADYGSPESVKKMKDITPGQAGAMLDKLMKRRKSKR